MAMAHLSLFSAAGTSLLEARRGAWALLLGSHLHPLPLAHSPPQWMNSLVLPPLPLLPCFSLLGVRSPTRKRKTAAGLHPRNTMLTLASPNEVPNEVHQAANELQPELLRGSRRSYWLSLGGFPHPSLPEEGNVFSLSLQAGEHPRGLLRKLRNHQHNPPPHHPRSGLPNTLPASKSQLFK